MKLELITPPTGQPISAAELRAHLWTIYPEKTTDEYLELLLRAATSHLETITWRRLVSQTWRLYLDEWPAGPIMLPYGAVSAVSKVAWLDAEGGDHVLPPEEYIPAVVGPEPMILPAGYGWPGDELFEVDAIRVDFVAGFGAPAEVPDDLRQAIQLLAAHWYETREAVIVGTTVRAVPFAFEALVRPWKIRYE